LAIQIDLPLYVGASLLAAPVELHCSRMPLEEHMGVGSLGVTWRSRLPDGTAVAVKRLRTSSRELSARLGRLLRLGDLDGANLLDVRSAFQEDGHLWVASRLDDGVHLSQLLERGPLPPACAVAVGTGMLEALTSLHQAGIWHGAVHGRNVHLGRDGTVRLGDYGLAGEPAGECTAASRASDVRAAGALLASALGLVLRPERAWRQAHTGRAGTGLSFALRAITGSPRLLPPGNEAAHAGLTLREGARGMANARRQSQARAHLAAMVAEIISG
jgi:serine/threonine protein kinase